jgi:hypothetical protein
MEGQDFEDSPIALCISTSYPKILNPSLRFREQHFAAY